MKSKIHISDLASYYLQNVKRRLNLTGQPNYIPMRIAFGRSLQVDREPIFEEANKEILEKARGVRGNEQPAVSTFEQDEGLIFQALLSQKYQRKIEDDEYVDKITAHVEHGLYLIYHETEKLQGYDYLAAIASKSETAIKNKSKDENNNIDFTDKPHADILSVRIGIDKETQQPIQYQINTANNPHFGLMGGSGSGKTYFLKHLLRQIRQQSHYDTHFVFFDYAKGDIAGDTDFLRDTQAQLIDVKKRPLPLNIFADAAPDEREQKATAERIVGVFKNVEASFGKVQEESLYNAIVSSYQNYTPYPDFENIREEVQKNLKKADTLTSILRPLVEQHYFAAADEMIWGTWTNKTLVIDIHQIERKDLVCFLILDRIFSELKKLGDAPFNKELNARKIRTVVVIDEAHNFLSVPKRAQILERMIREVRSMGGMVILASQSPDDYDTSNFDFLELLEFPVVLKSTPKSHKFLEQKFSLSAGEAKELLKEVGKLEQGESYLLFNKNLNLVKLCK
jgi:hypothetical protein